MTKGGSELHEDKTSRPSLLVEYFYVNQNKRGGMGVACRTLITPCLAARNT